MSSISTENVMIEARELSRSFGERLILDKLDFQVGKGEIFGLLGSNGAGKTTLIRMLTTLLEPNGGHVRVMGLDPSLHSRAVRRSFGYVSQMLSADGGLTGRENLKLSAKLYGLRGAARTQAIQSALDFMQLGDAGDRLVKTYSGGMIRRLELAQAMIHSPAVLFLDEPTIGLDPVARRLVWDRLMHLRREFGTTILLTTHDMAEVETLCDRIAILSQGKIAVCGKPAALKAALGEHAQLTDVFVQFTHPSSQAESDYQNAKQNRDTAKRLS